MVSWEDIINAIQGFYNWLVGIGAGFTNTLGELGSWIFGGFQWLGDRFKEGLDTLGQWFKDAINYIADRLREAYNTLATWIAPAIQWIGSGLSWIGQNLYAFGQWLYNGIVWVANAVWDFVSSGINWIMQQLSNIWNSISEGINFFVSSFNLTWNNWIKGLRSKFKQLLLVNLTVPTTIDAFQDFVKQPSIKKFLGLILAPVAGAVVTEIVDAVIPTPSSEQVNIFPPFSLPSWTWTQFSPAKPEYLEQPSGGQAMQPPQTPGYSPETETVCKIGTEYETTYRSGVYRNLLSNVSTEYSTSTQTGAVANLLSKNATDYSIYTGTASVSELLSNTAEEYETHTGPAYVNTATCTIGTEYYYEVQTS
jgi:hypothetical protein